MLVTPFTRTFVSLSEGVNSLKKRIGPAAGRRRLGASATHHSGANTSETEPRTRSLTSDPIFTPTVATGPEPVSSFGHLDMAKSAAPRSGRAGQVVQRACRSPPALS